MKAVMISIRPKWCEKIASGDKTIEVRKNRPKMEPPFKCFIYCTTGATLVRHPDGGIRLDRRWDALCGRSIGLNQKVIGEFTCDKIIEAEWDYKPDWEGEVYGDTLNLLKGSCLSEKEIISYGNGDEVNGYVYGWHISDLKIYAEPLSIDHFRKADFNCKRNGIDPKVCHSCYGCWDCEIKRPPQSWCYVEER